MNGVIQGGWEYVIAAYAISISVLVAYGATLVVRLRAERVRAEQELALARKGVRR